MTLWLTWLIPAAAAIGTASLGWAALDWIVSLLTRLVQRFKHPRRGNQLMRLVVVMQGEVVEELPTGRGIRRSVLSLPVLFPLLVAAAGIVGACVAADWLLSPALLLIGFWGAYMFRTYQGKSERRQDADHIQSLIETFSSVWMVRQSVFAALEEAVRLLPDGSVRDTVVEAVNRYRMNGTLQDCLQPLHQLRSPHLDEFAYILERVATSDLEVTAEMLAQLKTRVKKQRTRENRARVTAARLRSMVRVMQGALGAALIASLTLGLWRAYWLETFGHRLLFMGLVLGGIGMSAHFEGRVNVLGEEMS
jgi:hypothetical protein